MPSFTARQMSSDILDVLGDATEHTYGIAWTTVDNSILMGAGTRRLPC